MRVCFLVPGLSRSGGIEVVRDHARRMESEHGIDAAMVPTVPGPELHAALAETWDVALATWWTTVPWLAEMQAGRRGVFAQGFDPLHYRAEEFVDRLASTVALAAPHDVIGVSRWVCEMVRALRPEVRSFVARPGIDKEIFGGAPRSLSDGPLRVLVEGQPSVWFKGVAEALAATQGMRRRPEVTVVAMDPGTAGDVPADCVLGNLSSVQMAELYRRHDVVLKLSRFEGLGLAPIEAMHAGVPSIVTPFGGHAEYIDDGANGIVVGFDDGPGTVRALDALDADRELLAELSAGALATAASWPDAGEGTATLLEALGGLGPGEHDPAALRAVIAQAGWTRHELHRLRGAEAHELSRVAELEASRRTLAGQLEHAQSAVDAIGRQLEETRASRAYRAAVAVRSILPGRR